MAKKTATKKTASGPRFGIEINGLFLVIEFNNGVQIYEGVNGERFTDFDKVSKKHSFQTLAAAEKAAN